MLDAAQENLELCVRDMKLPVTIIRKNRAVGLVPVDGAVISREKLVPLAAYLGGNGLGYIPSHHSVCCAKDECALSTQDCILQRQHHLSSSQRLPFCAFNGGRDVWVDIGNKSIGVKILQEHLGTAPEETLHVGDQVGTSLVAIASQSHSAISPIPVLVDRQRLCHAYSMLHSVDCESGRNH